MSPTPIDWSQLWYPGPRRPFSADEMARAGADRPSRTLLAVAAVNFATLAFVVLQLTPRGLMASIAAVLVALAVLGAAAARWLWARPWRRPLMQAQLLIAALMLAMSLAVRWRVDVREERLAMALTFSIGCTAIIVALWFLVVWRAQQIESRLREQDERERAIEMARRLAAAQIEPHFLFNTLASLQHWVQTKDDRAASLLTALTGYLRATLPLFKRARLPAADEIVAVQRYLEVMQARMGARLRWRLEVPPELERAQLPPGLLLTLVENAIVHGLEPKLAGGEVLLRAARTGDRITFEVVDDGVGPPPDLRDGVGLANIRERLALTAGGAAALQVDAAPGGGCRAAFTLPYQTEERP